MGQATQGQPVTPAMQPSTHLAAKQSVHPTITVQGAVQSALGAAGASGSQQQHADSAHPGTEPLSSTAAQAGFGHRDDGSYGVVVMQARAPVKEAGRKSDQPRQGSKQAGPHLPHLPASSLDPPQLASGTAAAAAGSEAAPGAACQVAVQVTAWRGRRSPPTHSHCGQLCTAASLGAACLWLPATAGVDKLA